MLRPMLRPMLAATILPGLCGAAQAFDCAKARAPVETALCADPAAKASDEAMVAAFARVRGAASTEQRQALLNDQRAWLKQRNVACQSEGKPAACLAQSNEARVGVLRARPESGPGYEPAPEPFFVRQAGDRARVEVGVQVYRFAAPRNAGEHALNAQADKAVAAIAWKKDEPSERDWSHEVGWSLAYASPTFLSVRVARWDFSGGAHGSSGTGGLNIDMKAGRLLAFGDLFDAPARTGLVADCLAQVEAEKRAHGIEGDDANALRKAIDAVLGDLGTWTFTQEKVSVHFDHYTLGAYVEGSYDCALPLQRLNALSKIPLPPR